MSLMRYAVGSKSRINGKKIENRQKLFYNEKSKLQKNNGKIDFYHSQNFTEAYY